MKRPDPRGDDLMISHDLIDHLRGDAHLLVDFFHIYGRRSFYPDLRDFSHIRRWSGRGARQRFAYAVALLHVRGYLRWLPGGRYRIVSNEILTGAEHAAALPTETLA
jgi:hypothetical protein